MGRHSAPGQSAAALATAPPPAAPTIFVAPVPPTPEAPQAPVRRGRHAAVRPEVEIVLTPVEPPVAPVAVPDPNPEPPAAAPVAHHRHAARPVARPGPGPGPGLEVLAWTGFAALVAWAVIAADHDLSDATAWALGGAALIPLALLFLAPARLRERRARRRDQ